MREDMKNFRLPEGNTQQQWNSFEDKLHQMIDAPLLSRKAKSTRQKPWITKKVNETLNQWDRAHKKWQKSHGEKD